MRTRSKRRSKVQHMAIALARRRIVRMPAANLLVITMAITISTRVTAVVVTKAAKDTSLTKIMAMVMGITIRTSKVVAIIITDMVISIITRCMSLCIEGAPAKSRSRLMMASRLLALRADSNP